MYPNLKIAPKVSFFPLKIIQNPKKMEKRKFAVLLCAEDSEYVKKIYGGYFKVFIGLLEEEGETWDLYRVANGEFPSDELVKSYDGFVISGSCNDAHGNDKWICELVNLLKRLDLMKKKVLGVCFGHQVLSRALGGKTGRAKKGWDIGVTCIHPLNSNNLVSSLRIPSHLPIIECHRDEVWELPPFAEVIARSERTGVEMFKYGEHIMGIQGHPEYTKDILLHLIDRLSQRNLIQSCHAEEAKASLDATEPNREAWMRICRSFLKGKLVSP